MVTREKIKRARDVEEGTFVRVLDDVPNSELTIGDEGIVVDRPEGKFLLTEELDEPLPLASSTPLEIVSPVVEAPREIPMTSPRPQTQTLQEPPAFEEEFAAEFGPAERRPLTEEEQSELEELMEMDQNGDEMEPEDEDRLRSLGRRLQRFGRAAGQALGGAVELGAAAGAPLARGAIRGIGGLRQEETRRRLREGFITGVRETGGFVAERAEVPLAAAELGLRGVAAAETGTARLIRRLTGQQVRLSQVPAGTSVRFEDESPDLDIFRGDEGVVQFGVRRRRRRVFFPPTGETVFADPNMLVTVLGQRRITDAQRTSTGRRLITSPRARDDFEQRIFAPRRPAGVTPAPEGFRPRLRERPSIEDEFIPSVTEEDRFRIILGF